ncbi:MAG: hypothetical protein GY929_08215 [Actinomycetia bacterium]|nr:hypothetical protein [Actinomycetes bacterium]
MSNGVAGATLSGSGPAGTTARARGFDVAFTPSSPNGGPAAATATFPPAAG